MKKLIFVLMSIGLCAGVMAQTSDQTKTQTPNKTEVAKKQDMKHLRGDVREHQAATHQVNHDLSHVRLSKAVRDHKAVAKANKKEDIDAKRLELKGVGHPVAKAKRQVKVQDDNRKDHM